MSAKAQAEERCRSQPNKRQARSTFSILLMITILNYTDRSVLSAVLPKIHIDLGLTRLEEGLLALLFLSSMPWQLFSRADHSVRKHTVCFCVGVWSLIQNFCQLFIVCSVPGIGEVSYAPSSLSLLTDSFPSA
jgi:hypothetical protein